LQKFATADAWPRKRSQHYEVRRHVSS